MSNVRASDRLQDTGQQGFLLRSLAGFFAVCIALLLATNFAMKHIVSASIGDQASVMAAQFSADISDVLLDITVSAEGGRITEQQIRLLEERMITADIFELKLYDPSGRTLVELEPSGLSYGADEPELNEEARLVSETRDVLHFVEHDTNPGTGAPRTYVETYVPAVLSDGSVPVIEAYVDVTPLAANLKRRLDTYAIFFVIGGLVAYSLPALVLALRTRELRRRDMAVIKLSRRDGLTGLLNRGSAAEQFEKLLPQTEEDRVTLFYLDLDRFKSINDTMGHGAGDRMLMHIGACIASLTSEDDIAARFGGDEFVIVRRHPEGETDADLAEAILSAVSKPLDIFGQHVRPGISIGGYGLSPGEDFDDALRAADVALYEAKSHGRGRYVRHCANLVVRRDRRHAVETRVRKAIATDSFYLEYQPIYCSRAESLMGFEALLRLQAEDATEISPTEFIAVAESAGMIEELGTIALRRALEVASQWPDDIFIAVNVSALQLGKGRFPDLVAAELQRSGLRPDRLELELTESVFVEDDDAVLIEIADLKALGVNLALDDFGTGYSSLAYLWRLPFDKVKIDRAFLEGFEYDREKYAQFISTVVLLGRQMGMKVTAEGLETTDQLAMLENMGVQGYQGYLLGRPLPETVATDYAHRRPPPALMVLDDVGDEAPGDVKARRAIAGATASMGRGA